MAVQIEFQDSSAACTAHCDPSSVIDRSNDECICPSTSSLLSRDSSSTVSFFKLKADKNETGSEQQVSSILFASAVSMDSSLVL
jgi:hypothetical protein